MSRSCPDAARQTVSAMSAFSRPFKARSYAVIRHAGRAELTLRPCDTPWPALARAYRSGGGISFVLAGSSAESAPGESAEAFQIRCAAAGTPPDFLIDEDERNQDRAVIDLATGEDVVKARAEAIRRKKEKR